MNKADKLRAEDKRDDAAETERHQIYEDREVKILEINKDTTEQLHRQQERVDEAKSKPIETSDQPGATE